MARAIAAKKARGFLAPEYNIRCIEAAVNQPFEEGLKTEMNLFMELLVAPQARAQRALFLCPERGGQGAGIGPKWRSAPSRRWV